MKPFPLRPFHFLRSEESDMFTPNCPHYFPMLSLIFALLLTSRANVIFENVSELSGLVNASKLTSCLAQTRQTISSPDPLACARACSLRQHSCRAFQHSEPDRCELLSSPWRPMPTGEGQTLMTRRLLHPSRMTWFFNGSQYIVTEERGNFTEMKAACTKQGMHLWYPNSRPEMLFVQREILCYLPKGYFAVQNSDRIGYLMWLGVIIDQNGKCVLADNITSCINNCI